MLLLKACPRCIRGDLVVEPEEYGPVVTCLQCGYSAELQAVRRAVAVPAVVPVPREREEVAAA